MRRFGSQRTSPSCRSYCYGPGPPVAFAIHLSGNVVIEQILRYALIAIV
jgi:hypothetical protein